MFSTVNSILKDNMTKKEFAKKKIEIYENTNNILKLNYLIYFNYQNLTFVL